MDISKLTGDIEIENQYHVTSTGYTMGFWIFASNRDIGTNVLRVIYEDHFMIAIGQDTNLYGYCFIGLEYYDIPSKTNTITEINSFIAGIDASNINYKKSTNSIDEKKWRYIRCGYSYSAMKYYLDVNYEGFPSMNQTEEALKLTTYLSGDTMKLPPRKFLTSNPKLKISSPSGLTATKYIFIRNLALFSDYIHPNIHLHYK